MATAPERAEAALQEVMERKLQLERELEALRRLPPWGPELDLHALMRGMRAARWRALLNDLLGGATRLTWNLTSLAGLALIGVGILFLSLSGAVARPTSWWQGTWQALGVGFVVGGIVDVLTISAMSRFSIASQRRWNDEAWALVLRARTAERGTLDYVMVAMDAKRLLTEHGEVLDPGLRGELRLVADSLLERLRSLREWAEWARGEDPASPT